MDLAAAAVHVSLGEPDNNVEQPGWRPKTQIIEGPAGEGGRTYAADVLTWLIHGSFVSNVSEEASTGRPAQESPGSAEQQVLGTAGLLRRRR